MCVCVCERERERERTNSSPLSFDKGSAQIQRGQEGGEAGCVCCSAACAGTELSAQLLILKLLQGTLHVVCGLWCPPVWTKAKRSRHCFGYQGFFDAPAVDESESDLLTNIKNNCNN